MSTNTGLPSNFELDEGKFALTSGEAKIDDTVVFFMSFFGFFRIYTQDFPINIYLLFQRHFNDVRKRKGVFLMGLLNSMNKYINHIVIEQSDIEIERATSVRPKGIGVIVQYRHNLAEITVSKVIKFIKSL